MPFTRLLDFKFLYAGKIWYIIGFTSAITSLTLLTDYTVSHPQHLRNKPFQKRMVGDKEESLINEFDSRSLALRRSILIIIIDRFFAGCKISNEPNDDLRHS